MAVAGPTVTLAASFLDWARSGQAGRSSYGLVRSAETLGVLPSGLGWLALLWHLLPVVVGLVWLAAAVGLRRGAGALAVAVGLGAGAVVVAVARSPLPLVGGVVAAIVGAGLSVLGGVAVFVVPHRASGAH